MKVTVLVENTSCNHLKCEHGLSLLIEFNGKSYLLDAGSTDLFIENAQSMNVDILNVKCCILSHGHNDHSGGFVAYLKYNKTTTVYAMKTAFDRHYSGSNGKIHEISVPSEIVMNDKDRFTFIDDVTIIDKNVYLVPHHTKDLALIGKRSQMYVKENDEYVYDDFSHELSLVFDTEKGLVIFNSCSHAGINNIIREIKDIFPKRKIYAFIGGLHLKGKKDGQEICAYSNEEIKIIANDFLKEDIQALYTGHCTGKIGYQRLEKILNHKIHALTVGKVIDI